MLFEDASVHDDEQACLPSALGGLGMDHAFLHPHCLGPDANGVLDHLRHVLGAAEDIYDVHFVGHFFQARVGFLAEHFLFVGIDGNDSVAGRYSATP